MVSASDAHGILKCNSKPACLLIMTKCHPMANNTNTLRPLPGAALGPPVWHFSMIPRAGVAFCSWGKKEKNGKT